jgi:hypothetical protein
MEVGMIAPALWDKDHITDCEKYSFVFSWGSKALPIFDLFEHTMTVSYCLHMF